MGPCSHTNTNFVNGKVVCAECHVEVMEEEASMKTYFGFALGDSMFVGDCTIIRRVLSIEETKSLVAQGVESCCNPSHKATIDAMRSRFGIEVAIPEKPPIIALHEKDSIIVMGVRGLPRLTDRHEYTEEEITKGGFSFTIYTVAK